MYISKIRIREFKTFDSFDLELKDGLNILAGDNDAGKSTVLEAMHLALTASYRGAQPQRRLARICQQRVHREILRGSSRRGMARTSQNHC